jgi:hypothetical protein
MQAPVPAATQQISAMEGFLCGRKKTLRAHKDMVESWGVLAGTTLSLFPSKEASSPTTVLEVTGTGDWDGKAMDIRKHAFSLKTARHTYQESAASEEEKLRWAEAVKLGVANKAAFMATLKASAEAQTMEVKIAMLHRLDYAETAEDFVALAKSGAIGQAALVNTGGIAALVSIASLPDSTPSAAQVCACARARRCAACVLTGAAVAAVLTEACGCGCGCGSSPARPRRAQPTACAASCLGRPSCETARRPRARWSLS